MIMYTRVGNIFYLLFIFYISYFQHLTQNTMLLLICYQLVEIHSIYLQIKRTLRNQTEVVMEKMMTKKYNKS